MGKARGTLRPKVFDMNWLRRVLGMNVMICIKNITIKKYVDTRGVFKNK